MYIFRLDDACENMDVKKWNKVEQIFDYYKIQPIVGIIPDNKDESLIKKYPKDILFWDKAKKWQAKGWIMAQHGFQHQYATKKGGINPVQKRSEFAGLTLVEQSSKIKNGYSLLKQNGINPTVFFAPSHTFDKNTLKAIRETTKIQIVSDTIANDIYYAHDLFFVPVQTGTPRKLPFRICTICLHPNEMTTNDFSILEKFIIQNQKEISPLTHAMLKKRKINLLDQILQKIYFLKRRIIK